MMASHAAQALDGAAYRALFEAGARCVEVYADAINALNVFPVPDGDTGINMVLTLRAAVSGAEGAEDGVAAVSRAISRAALYGARGNSGVIMSQFLKGAAAGLEDCEECDGEALARSLASAADAGYQAVGKPVEGTMLTVMRAAAEGAAQANANPAQALRAAYEAAEVALAKTPEQLPVLAEAGVVDAGGQGVVAFLAGALGEIDGEPPALAIDAPGASEGGPVISETFLEHAEDEMYGYCTQFIIEGEGLDPGAIQEQVMAAADSTVVVGDDRVVRVHVHAEDPGPLLSLGVRHGALAQINIQNMDAQHEEFVIRHGHGDGAEPADFAVVAVAPSAAFERIFHDYGAAVVVSGGQTMNPSAAELAAAVKRANAQHVAILPNNPNIVMAANQAAELAETPCVVVPSRSIPQGVAAMIAVDHTQDAETNGALMREALAAVRSGEVTIAVRSTSIDGLPVAEGQALALLDDRFVGAFDSVSGAMAGLLERAEVEDGALVTLYRGADRSAEDAASDVEAIAQRWPGIEAELVEGGQPHYHYLVSVE